MGVSEEKNVKRGRNVILSRLKIGAKKKRFKISDFGVENENKMFFAYGLK